MLMNFVIRPQKSTYPKDKVGTITINYKGKTYKQQNLELKNKKGETLCCSFVEPIDEERPAT